MTVLKSIRKTLLKYRDLQEQLAEVQYQLAITEQEAITKMKCRRRPWEPLKVVPGTGLEAHLVDGEVTFTGEDKQ